MSIIEKLTEGIMKRDVQAEGQALLNKWEKTGLLEGIEKDHNRNSMAALLENQAKELLREASTMAGGDVEGFAAVAFPIVRRVFGGLIANELVSVQPMSLPSGLIFFLDFTFADARLGQNKVGDSLYGGGVVGRQITGGVDLSTISGSQTSFYNLNNGYSSPTGSTTANLHFVASGTYGAGAGLQYITTRAAGGGGITSQDDIARLLQYDPMLQSGSDTANGGSSFAIYRILTASSALKQSNSSVNLDNLVDIRVNAGLSGTTGVQTRWLTQFSGTDGGFLGSNDNAADPGIYVMFIDLTNQFDLSNAAAQAGASLGVNVRFPVVDAFTNGGADVGSVVGTTVWGLENQTAIPEIDIKVDSVSITADTKKLKAKWTPELQQDINAYHNLDAEVELTGILSEQIALEIDQEILEDLVKGAKAGTYYWSRKPGKFVNRTGTNGGTPNNQTLFPDFTGTVSEWYETLLETVNDVSAQIHRKTLRGGANFLVTSPEVANVLEFTSGFRADTTADENRGTAGAVKVGQISKKWDIYVDPYFPRNLILVGRKGNSFLESGYVYAPYVPLQVTPTIFGPEDFVPRKGVMTRYGKKMVRPDMYGLVVVEDLV
jgi:hypothetical protein